MNTKPMNEGVISKILEEFEPEKEHLISILHRIQDEEEFHYISEEAIREIADYLGITLSEVYSTISFYSMFSTEPRGKYIVRVCVSAPCFVMGSMTIIDSLEEILGIRAGETTDDHLFTIELSSCLGICDRAPAMMINDNVYPDLIVEKIKEIIEGNL